MKLLSEGIKRHMGHNTFIIRLLMVEFVILGVHMEAYFVSNILKIAAFPTQQSSKLSKL